MVMNYVKEKARDLYDGSADAVKAYAKDVVETVSVPNFDPVQKNGSLYHFPEDLVSGGEALRPVIRFTCFERTGKTGGPTRHSIILPCPPNIVFSDNAAYSTIDLGQIGQRIVTGIETGQLGGDAEEMIGAALTTGGGGVDLLKAGVQQAAQKIFQNTTNQVLFGQKIIKNPNTNTSYTGSGIRSYTFNFKLIANTPEESITIKHIHQLFRKMMYAARSDGGTQYLKYPATWGIDFMKIDNGKLTRNDYVPVPYACYLTACNTTFNAAADSWHSKGQPFEVDVSINFQETRNLFQQDIDALESIAADPSNKENQQRRGFAETGLAKSSVEEMHAYAPSADAQAQDENNTQMGSS